MPYITPSEQEYFDPVIKALDRVAITNPGELNYMLTMVIQRYMKGVPTKNYQSMNNVIGALDCCKEEFRRRVINPYESYKMSLNGDIYVEEVLK